MSKNQKTGILTFLFTDLEKSTQLWEQFPEKMRLALARHDTLIEDAIEKYNGTIVKSTGDGFHAVFESPTDGIAAALATQQALNNERWPEETGALKVRMGLHSGESQERDGDYFGPALNRAARIMSSGHGGQIVLSHTTATLIGDTLPPNVTLIDLGEHQLRDLTKAEHLYQLNHPELVSDFPPLNTLSTFKHNLPIQLTSFIGREKELAKIKQITAPSSEKKEGDQNESRLLTLLGPGGTGKTRLALQSAADLVDQFPDGVWLVELAPITDPDVIPERVAATLNVSEQRGRPILDTLTNYLRQKDLLLVFDNVEHLVRESAELVEHLLTQCPMIKILVTGREALFIDGEVTLQIPSLSLPERQALAPDAVTKSEAIQLFVDRAQAVSPDFCITPENTPALVETVRRLDGIPLALELAAARLRMMSIEQIAERLNDRFRLLTGGRRTALPRQQTLQALIDWSWNLLDEKEQTLLRRLSVFSGGWTLEAALAVASDEDLDESDVLDLLEQLINKSLVNVEHLPKGDMRYSMLESIRQYARDRLFEAGEGESLRDRHAEYFTIFGEQMSKELEGRDMLIWLDRFLRDLDNAKTAREWAVESRLDLALRMTSVSMIVRRYWFFTKEGRRWVSEVVKRARAGSAMRSDPEYQKDLAGAVVTLGAATFGQGEGDQARPILEEGITLARDAGAVEHHCYGMIMLLIILLQRGEFTTAQAVAEEILALTQEHRLDLLRIMAFGYFTPVFASQGNREQAREFSEEMFKLAEQHGNPWMLAMASLQKGFFERYSNNLAEAEALFFKANKLFEAVRDTPFTFISLSEAGHIRRLRGDYNGAEEIYRQTILYFQEGEGRSSVIHQLECFGMIAVFQNQHVRGATLLGAAQAHREEEQSVRLPNEQVEFDQALEHVANAIGGKERDAAFTEGGKMSIDKAVQFALEK